MTRSMLLDQTEPQKTKIPKTTVFNRHSGPLNGPVHDVRCCDPRQLADSNSESSNSTHLGHTTQEDRRPRPMATCTMHLAELRWEPHVE